MRAPSTRPSSDPAQAEAFALLSEEGIAKGVRRIVGLTRGEAQKAIAEAQRLGGELAAMAALPDADLEKAVKAFKEVGGGAGGRGPCSGSCVVVGSGNGGGDGVCGWGGGAGAGCDGAGRAVTARCVAARQ
jgi:hypothetical protein